MSHMLNGRDLVRTKVERRELGVVLEILEFLDAVVGQVQLF